MFDTDSQTLIKIKHIAAGCSLWHCPWDSVMVECVSCFPHHVLLVMAPVSCCNSPAGRALVFPLSLSLPPQHKGGGGWEGWHIFFLVIFANSSPSVAQYPASPGESCQILWALPKSMFVCMSGSIESSVISPKTEMSLWVQMKMVQRAEEVIFCIAGEWRGFRIWWSILGVTSWVHPELSIIKLFPTQLSSHHVPLAHWIIWPDSDHFKGPIKMRDASGRGGTKEFLWLSPLYEYTLHVKDVVIVNRDPASGRQYSFRCYWCASSQL